MKILTTERKWSENKKPLEYAESKKVKDRTLSKLLRELVNLGLVEKIHDKCVLADSLIGKAWKNLIKTPGDPCA